MKLGKMSDEVHMAYLMAQSQNVSGRTGETHDKPY
jgi:hypothetical protein